MKKFIALFFMIISFSATANAQDRQKEIAKKVQNDITALTSYISLTDEQKVQISKGLEMKHLNLTPELPEGRKKELVRVVEHYLRAPLTQAQLQKLDANPTLVKRLVSE